LLSGISNHHQPIVRLQPQIIGFEALLRWQHPKWGLVYPAEFMKKQA